MPDHGLKAFQVLLEKQVAMIRPQLDWADQGLPPSNARLGLHSGSLRAGNIGPRERFNYTVQKNTVNLASRLEGVNKAYGTQIGLSNHTCRLVQDSISVRKLDLLQVKGRGQPGAVCELLGSMPPEGPPLGVKRYYAGLRLYRECQWEETYLIFGEILHLKPNDAPSLLFQEPCCLYAASPLPGLAGVFVLEGKKSL